MINGSSNDNKEFDLTKEASFNANETVNNDILYYNEEGKKSLYLCFIPIIIFFVGYILSGGSFSEGDGGAVWWFYFPLFFVVIPIEMFVSIYLGINGLKGSKKIPSYISLIINGLELLFVIMIMR